MFRPLEKTREHGPQVRAASFGSARDSSSVTPDTCSHVPPGMGDGLAEAMDEAPGHGNLLGLPTRFLPANRDKSGEGGIRTHETA